MIVIQGEGSWKEGIVPFPFKTMDPDNNYKALHFSPSEDSESMEDSAICMPFLKAQDDLNTGLIPFNSSTANTSYCTVGSTTILAATKLDMLKDIYTATPAWLYLAESRSDCYKAITTGEYLENGMLYLRRVCNGEVWSNALTTYKGYVISTQPVLQQNIIE